MTASTDFDRFLTSVLETDGPQTIDVRAVDAALASARSIPQRRPLVRRFDRRAWPAGRPAASRADTRRLVLVGAVALLVVTLVAAIIVSSGRSRPSLDLLADGARVTYSDDATLAFVDAAEVMRRPNVVLGRGGVPTIVPGTNLATVSGFGEWQVIDRPSGQVVATVDTSYAGGERWSVSGDHLALIDVAGVVSVVSFVDQASPTTTRYEVPGLLWADFSKDARRMAVAVAEGATLGIDVVDLDTGERRRVSAIDHPDMRLALGDVWLTWASDAEHVVVWMSVGEAESAVWIVGLDGTPATPIETPLPVSFAATVSPDGSQFVTWGNEAVYLIDVSTGGATILDSEPTWPIVGWSSDSRRMATIRDGLLRLIDTDGTDPTTELTGVVGAEWMRDRDVIVVAKTVSQGLSIDAVAGDGGEFRNLALIDDLQPTGMPVVTVHLQEVRP